MKKTLQFILILAVAIGSFLSPISAVISRDGIEIAKNEARAEFPIKPNFDKLIKVNLTIDPKNIFDKQAKFDADFKALVKDTFKTLDEADGYVGFKLEVSKDNFKTVSGSFLSIPPDNLDLLEDLTGTDTTKKLTITT